MTCGMPKPPVNGSIAGQDFTLGARAMYQCNPGFRLASSLAVSVACQLSGRWSPNEAPPRCIPVTCPDIGHAAVDHGRWRLIYGSQSQYDAMMMLICDPGYYYKGQRVIRCQANSTWDYPEPRPACESESESTSSTMHFVKLLQLPWESLSMIIHLINV
uniref:Sushi domain-containing protein n=1 Tax=Hucho hucho TaxID=62062 RepID=A0A4W5KZN3_9TELE